MTSSIDGLVSGLNTTSLISQLMKVEAMPQDALKTRQASTTKLITALQSVNTKVASLATFATNTADPASWTAATATVSTPASGTVSATATTTSSAQPGSMTFSVDQVATAQVSLSNLVPDNGTLVPQSPPSVTVRKADGTYLTVEPASGSLADVAAAVNKAADAGIRATVVRVTTGATPEYRIQFTGTTTGADGSFEVFAGTQADVVAATAAGTDQSLRIDQNSFQLAQNAKVTLWKGNPALEQTVEQSSNTFSELMTGVDVTVTKVTAAGDDPTTVTVARDSAAMSTMAKNFIGSLGLALSDISSQTATTTTTDSSGKAKVTGGVLSGESAVRDLSQQLVSAASMPVGGKSPSSVGITLNMDGTFTFDEDAFATAFAADPAGVQTMLTGIASRVQSVATTASDASTGTLTEKITSEQGVVSNLGDQIDGWDVRLQLRQTALEKTYSALEVSLSNLQSQQSWLTGQLASLPTSSG
jgi:flagellar hook-associated protein 2